MDEAWSEDVAAQTCESALASANVDTMSSPRLIRLGTNAVYKVDTSCGKIIARVSPNDYDAELLAKQIEFSSWLVENGFETSEPLLRDVVWIGGRATTLWQYLESDNPPVSIMRPLGSLVRKLHTLTDEYSGNLPTWEPLGRLGERLDSVPSDDSFTEGDRSVLQEWRDHLSSAAGALNFELPQGPIHGDVHTGNTVYSHDRLYLIDLDRIANGPREWELAQPLVAHRMFAKDDRGIDSFMEGYGWDLRKFNGATALVDLRALFMTSWLLTLPRDERVKNEIRNRILYWRNPDGDWPLWRPR